EIPMLRLAFLAVAMVTLPAVAQEKIGKPVRLVVGFAAGGSVDLVARMMAERLSPRLGQPVIVENRPGGFVRVAIDAVRSAAPDGATLLLTSSTPLTVTPHAYLKVPYDAQRDLLSVARLVNGQQGFALGPMSGARTWPEYVAWVKANPDKGFFASSGVGSMGHLVGVVLARTSGLRLEHVAYKGSGHYNAELMGGQVSAGISGIADASEHHRSGKLRIVATSGAERSRALPDVPTFTELGVAMDLSLWYGVFAPAGTPPAIVELLGRELVAIVAAPDMTERFVKLGLEPAPAGPRATSEHLAADYARWRPIVQQAGFKLD
ncbi:MAG TPA: tripartite tricarboxylate transporter substrate-binding protein, partial [Burkholderiales bacterium]|nr:tripartite tricarboxylate transporter substrate-binding protein [Burkholderiales bacterium]